MNKIFKGLLLMATLVLTLSSCRDEADIPDHGAAINPEKEIEGTYTGTWTKTQRGSTAEPTVVDGTLTFTATEEAYIANVKIACAGDELGFTNTASFTCDESRTNVVKQSSQYMFYNTLDTSGIGTKFNGTVSFGGEATMKFSKSIKSGRKTYTYDFVFNGVKE